VVLASNDRIGASCEIPGVDAEDLLCGPQAGL
jgi:hypothetical protein